MILRFPLGCFALLAPMLAQGVLAGASVDIASESAQVDALVDAGLQAKNIAANPPVSDAVFLRRIYLDCIGRIPTFAEANAFLADAAPDRRARLIAALQGSDGWVSHQFNWWADLLRVQSKPGKNYSGEPYIDWLKQQIRADTPFDAVVRDLITAKGHVLERGNGATGYYVRDANMALDNMSNTVQVFLGTRVTCAQCHDHPFDTWTRMQYMQMAAFTSTTNAAPDKDFIKALRTLAKNDGDAGDKAQKDALKKITKTVALVVADKDSDTISLPKDYQYPDGKPGQTVTAHPMFGDVAVAPGQDPRDAYALWLTAPDNPRFTEVIANRMWKKVFGLGLIEPVDNLTATTVANEPALMDHLTALMKKVGYDLKIYQAILYNTHAYQRAATATDANPGDPYYFPGPILRRMGAEEVWDSLLTLVVPDLDQRTSDDAERLYAYYDEMKSKTPEQIIAMIAGDPATAAARRDLDEQIKAMVKKAGSRDALKDDPAFQKLLQEQREQRQSMAANDPEKPQKKAAAEDPRWKGYDRDLMRASELPSPAPPGHLLRDFGQSDRMLIENSSANAAVTQALNLLNGFVDEEILRENSVLIGTIAAQTTAEAKARAAFICILAREPTAKELAWAEAEMARTPPQGADPADDDADGPPVATSASATATTAVAADLQGKRKKGARKKPREAADIPKGTADLLWSLINTDEFLFEQ
jgi:hypothetical protein